MTRILLVVVYLGTPRKTPSAMVIFVIKRGLKQNFSNFKTMYKLKNLLGFVNTYKVWIKNMINLYYVTIELCNIN